MAREHPDFRNMLEQLNLHFPGRELLTRQDVMKVTGYSLSSVQRHYPFKDGRIAKVKLARLMCD